MRRFFGELLRHGNVNSRALSHARMFEKTSYPSASQLEGLRQDIEFYKIIENPSALDCKKLLDRMHEIYDLCDYHVNFDLYICLDELNGLLWNKFNYRSAGYDSIAAMRESVKTFRMILKKSLAVNKNERIDELRAQFKDASEEELLQMIHEKTHVITSGIFAQDDEYCLTAARISLHPELSTVMIANRGYGAYYVAREYQKRGVKVIMLLPEFDKGKYFASVADEVITIKENPYDIAECRTILTKVLANGHKDEVFGVDPVWGYVSENHLFSAMVSEVGMKFLGPDAHAMHTLGDKDSARKAIKAIHLDPIPGFDEIKPGELLEKAKKIGFPVMLKGVEGGAGRQNRKAHNEQELVIADVEIKGNKILEKYIGGKEHTEGQLFVARDAAVYLGLRLCSWQVYGEKNFEESIGVEVSQKWRVRMQKAIALARGYGYVGALTVEFLGDYFMEFNTRKQFELHTTETTLGGHISITEMQREVAATGLMMPYLRRQLHKLGISHKGLSAQGIVQLFSDISPDKYCMQMRINAVDVVNDNGVFRFCGTKGVAKPIDPKILGPKNQIITSVGLHEEINTISHDTFPTIAVVYGKGPDREGARHSLLEAVNLDLMGDELTTNLPYARFVLQHPTFIKGPKTDSSIEVNMEYLAQRSTQNNYSAHI